MENCFEKPAAISLQPLIVTIYQMISRYQMTIFIQMIGIMQKQNLNLFVTE